MDVTRRSFILILGLSVFWATRESQGIIRGSNALAGLLKYQVSLQLNGEHMCGGTIIDDRYVLTAAHCFLDSNMTNYEGSFSVLANVTDLNYGTSSAIKVDVEKIFVPTDFRPDLAQKKVLFLTTGDIAVIKLKAPLGLDRTRSIKKAELPLPGLSYEGSKAVVSGFGYNGFENKTDPQTNMTIINYGILQNKLRYINVNIISNAECQQIVGPVQLSPQHLCGKPAKKREGTCGGDSGGPLVYRNIIVGVVSGGVGECGDDKIPATYTRVSSYLDFIKKAMSDDKSPITYVTV